MSDVLSTVGLVFDSSSVRKASQDLDAFGQAGKRSEQRLDGLTSAFSAARTAAAAYAAVRIAREVLQQADAFTNLNARLALVTSSTANLAAVQAQLYQVSQRTRVDNEKTVDLYASLARATKPLGVAQKDLVSVTESINKALIVSGTNAVSASAALVQLGQGFASGVLRGDELNSILEQTPRLAQAIADGLGVPVGALRKLGEAGELTADKVFNALKKAGGSIDREFARMPMTVGQSTTVLGNSIQQLIGVVDKMTGTSPAIAEWVKQFSTGVDGVTERIQKSGGLWQGYVDSLKLGLAQAGLDSYQEKVERMAKSAEIARRKLAEGGTSIYLKDEVAEYDRARAAVVEYQKAIDDLNGKNVSKKDTSTEDAQDAALAPYRAADALLARQRQARVEFLKEFATDSEKFQAEVKKQKAAMGGLYTPADEARLREKFLPKLDAKTLDLGIDQIKLRMESLQGVYRDNESILEAQRTAGLISLEDYYDVKAGLIKKDLAAQVRAYEEQNALLESDRVKNKGKPQALEDAAKIAENNAKIAEANNKASTSLAVLGIQGDSALKNVARGYDEARQAAEQFYAEQIRGQQREIALIGASDRERQNAQGRAQIEDKYESERRRIRNERALLEQQQPEGLREDQRKRYDQQLALQDEFEGKSLASYQKSVDQRLAEEGRWQNGASRAIANYVDNVSNSLKQTETAYANIFGSLEDTLANFIKTGKLNFKSLADTIISELARVEARKIVASYSSGIGSLLASAFGSIFGGGASSSAPSDVYSLPTTGVRFGRAIGGPVSAGSTYQVNERGIPEIATVGGRDYMTMGSKGGKVTPLDSGQLAPSFHFNIGAGVQRGEIVALIPELERRIKASLMSDARRPGGRS